MITPARVGLVLGPALALLAGLTLPAQGLAPPAAWTAGLALWMAVWWASEAAPIAATSLLPLVVLPLVGAGSEREAAAPYASPIVLFLLGGFIVAQGVERSGLHKRLALNVVARVGARPLSIVAGFMASAALTSMWISNTATSLMLAPIAASLAAAAGGSARFAQAMLLGLAWAATIGGLATPVGTPTNLIAIGWLSEQTGQRISFMDWLAVGLPATALLLPAAWLAAAWGLWAEPPAPQAAASARAQAQALGPMRSAEARVLMVFAAVAVLWVLGEPLAAAGLPIGETAVAIGGALALLLIPAGGGERRALLTWEEAQRLPWGVVLLFGGGLSLAAALERTGMAVWLGGQLQGLAGAPPLAAAFVVTAIVIVLTEFMSNVAAITLLLPILGALAVGAGIEPVVLIAPAAIASSCGFMMPAGTGPNAVAYGSGAVRMGAMMGRGFFVNAAALFAMSALGVWLAPHVLGNP